MKSTNIHSVNRLCYQKVLDYPQYRLQPSALIEYRMLYNKPFSPFHEAEIKLNRLIWLADRLDEQENRQTYEIDDKRIIVYEDTIIKVITVNYVRISNHWRVMRRIQGEKDINEDI